MARKKIAYSDPNVIQGVLFELPPPPEPWYFTIKEYDRFRNLGEAGFTYDRVRYKAAQMTNDTTILLNWLDYMERKAGQQMTPWAVKTRERAAAFREWLALRDRFITLALEFVPEWQLMELGELRNLLRQSGCIIAQKQKPVTKEKAHEFILEYWKNRVKRPFFSVSGFYHPMLNEIKKLTMVCDRLRLPVPKVFAALNFLYALSDNQIKAFNDICHHLQAYARSQGFPRYMTQENARLGVRIFQVFYRHLACVLSAVELAALLLELFLSSTIPAPFYEWVVNRQPFTAWNPPEERTEYHYNYQSTRVPPSVHPWHMTLGVTPNATPEQVKVAYYQLSRQYHPDLNPDPSALELMKTINNAYDYYKNWIAI